MSNVGDTFQMQTKYLRDRMPRHVLDWHSQPELYKSYPASETIQLPRCEPSASTSLHDAIKRRQSVRGYRALPIGIESLGYLLWASTGIVRQHGGYQFRTAPSAGALYPIETYLVVNRVKELDAGVYHYAIDRGVLETLKKGNCQSAVSEAALDQQMCSDAAVVFVWTAIFERSKWKYGQRAYRYIYLDAGHIAENLALAAVSLGLGSCQIGALFDDEANRLVDVDGVDESVVYMSVVGVPAE